MQNISRFYYICILKKSLTRAIHIALHHKIATNQSLNQKSRCFYIGALFLYSNAKLYLTNTKLLIGNFYNL